MSLRDQLVKRCQFRLASVRIEEWGGQEVWVRSLGASDLAELMDAFGFFDPGRKEGEKVQVDISTLCKKGRLYWLLVRSICDKEGGLQFSTDEESLLAGGDVGALLQIAGEALRISVEGVAEGAAGNSNGAHSGASSTDSALLSESPTPTSSLSLLPSLEDGSTSLPASPSESLEPTSVSE